MVKLRDPPAKSYGSNDSPTTIPKSPKKQGLIRKNECESADISSPLGKSSTTTTIHNQSSKVKMSSNITLRKEHVINNNNSKRADETLISGPWRNFEGHFE